MEDLVMFISYGLSFGLVFGFSSVLLIAGLSSVVELFKTLVRKS